ncbi:MAG: hypothetical protein ACE5GJ_14115 [Gemmatimonadota bacterium]
MNRISPDSRSPKPGSGDLRERRPSRDHGVAVKMITGDHLAIAYDNTKIQMAPVRWNMPELLTVASVLGVSGVISSFLLFFILVQLDFSMEMIQSLFFAKLVVAGHGTIYNTRTDEWFWKKPYPSWILFGATFSTRVLGTLIAVYGFLITPIGWKLAGYMWAYALAWFVFNDVMKVGTYTLLRRRGLYT